MRPEGKGTFGNMGQRGKDLGLSIGPAPKLAAYVVQGLLHHSGPTAYPSAKWAGDRRCWGRGWRKRAFVSDDASWSWGLTTRNQPAPPSWLQQVGLEAVSSLPSLPGPLLIAFTSLTAASSFSKAQEEEITPVVSIAYKVLEVFPKGRRVLITCHAPQASPPITYSLCGTKNIEVAKKVVKTHEPASFNLNITLKSSPDLLTYFCRAATTSGAHVDSARLQMYWELWSKPVSELRANFTLRDRGSGPRVEMSCQASSGSPPITYSLVGKDGQVHLQQRPRHGQPANFSFLPGQTSDWFQCQAANSVNVQHSALTLVPPGEKALGFPEAQLALLCWEGASVQDTGRWEVGQLYPATAESTEGTGGNHAHPGPCLKEAQPSCLRPAPRRVTQGTHHCAGWQPRLHCGRHLRDAGLDHVGQVMTRR
ncbi:protein IL-40 isoform X1 [Papio anubis]|uniref:protein IL-40 isoform X1 n=1 Tax=Papio anubis TaxID=9555 RepID=UPI0012AE7200|nr:protein IL-40 isoform X1 [Papio anubis]